MVHANHKIIGRSANCDLSLVHPSVSRQHARAERADDGRLLVQDSGSLNGTWLCRSDQWIRATRISLCREDLLRFGKYEVKPEQLASLFGPENRVWLPAVPQPSIAGSPNKISGTATDETPGRISKPRRNPVTGQIEENKP